MRIIKSHKCGHGVNEYLRVAAHDEPDHEIGGGACHEYTVHANTDARTLVDPYVARVSFQYGGLDEHGLNGCSNESLLAIVIDRLQSLQAGPFACQENADALSSLERAMRRLHNRTEDRAARGVEGESKE